MREVVGHQLVNSVGGVELEVVLRRHVVGRDPVVHLLDEVGIVAATVSIVPNGQAPFGERHRLPVLGREVALPGESVGLAHEVVPASHRVRVIGDPALVVDVLADVVDVGIAGVGLVRRDGDLSDARVPLELEVLAGHAPHRGDDLAEVGRVGGGIRGRRPLEPGPVELPSDADDRIALAAGNEVLPELREVGVVAAARSRRHGSTGGGEHRHGEVNPAAGAGPPACKPVGGFDRRPAASIDEVQNPSHGLSQPVPEVARALRVTATRVHAQRRGRRIGLCCRHRQAGYGEDPRDQCQCVSTEGVHVDSVVSR